MSKRTSFLLAAFCLVLGGAAGFAWHAPGRPSTWVSARTWVGFAVVVIGVAIALFQLEMQRRQLAGQQAALRDEFARNKGRDMLLDGQLRELRDRELMREREQAEQIGLVPGQTPRDILGFQRPPDSQAYTAEVANKSRRPIRNIACRIEAAAGDGLQESRLAGVYAEADFPRTRVFIDFIEASRWHLVRAGETAEFIFAVDVPRHPGALRFTDDAGLHWQINHDLHLERLENRDW